MNYVGTLEFRYLSHKCQTLKYDVIQIRKSAIPMNLELQGGKGKVTRM